MLDKLIVEFVKKNLAEFECHVTAFLVSLHKQGFIHNDVRLPNVVLVNGNGPTFCVIDYENICPICPKNCTQIHGKKKILDTLTPTRTSMTLKASLKL